MITDHLWLAFVILSGVFSLGSAGHALLYKRDPRSALGWVAVCLLVHPLVGALLYWTFGVNRIQTTARRWQRSGHWTRPPRALASETRALHGDVGALAAVSERVTRAPLLGGNRVAILENGEEAYPAMLESIGAARRSVYLSTYIFDTDRTGTAFIEALGAAAARGVDVRVLVDGMGALYSFPPAFGRLRAAGVRASAFLPLTKGVHVNLRNHRKLLIVDTATAYTGGMNIGDRHLATNAANPGRVADLHFRIDGPCATQVEDIFVEDWRFATGDTSHGAETWPDAAADSLCRGISDGPNHDFEKLLWVIVGAISSARKSVRIMTPYFLPDWTLISALTAAAFRGVAVDIVLPRKNNLPYVAWATQAILWQLLRHGIRVHYQPPPFAHTKYLLVDSGYALIGSSNLDPRSLRLNFEFNVEIYDAAFVEKLGQHFEAALRRSIATTLSRVDTRPLAVKLRDATAKLFIPYL